VKNYPVPTFDGVGLRPLQVGMIVSLVATSIAGILSNPLFSIANSAVARTPMLHAARITKPVAVNSSPKIVSSLPAK